MATRNVYLKIETIPGYSPVMPTDHATPPVQYGRDCMRNMGHEDGTIPADDGSQDKDKQDDRPTLKRREWVE